MIHLCSMTLLLMSVCLSAHVVMLHLDVTQQHTVKQVLIKLIKTLSIMPRGSRGIFRVERKTRWRLHLG